MVRSERPNSRSISPGPAMPCLRRIVRRRARALPMWRNLESRSRRLLGRTPRETPKAITWRLMAKVATEVTAGTPSSSATHRPQGAAASQMR